MGVGEAQTAVDEYCLDRLLSRLLGVEAQVFRVNARRSLTGRCEIALRPVEPFAGLWADTAYAP